MAGTINSLGIGSGVLTADVIEKLKANDTSLIISPIDQKITLQKQKSSAIDLLKSLMTNFKSSVNALDDDALYQKRSVSGNNSSVNVTASAGVTVQSFSISDTKLAQKNVLQSGSFSSNTATIASGSGTMTLSIDGKSYNIDYTNTTTLDQLKDSINSVAGSKIKASTLQVGENDYRLILTSAETGATQNITLTDSAGGSLKGALLQKDSITSGLFSSPTALVASGAVAQSDRFDLSDALSDGGLSVDINGATYSVPFNGTHDQTLADFKTLLDASGVVTASIDPLAPNSITITANTPGTPYTITTPFSSNDTVAVESTTHLTDNVTPSGIYNITMDGMTYNIAYDQNTTLQQLTDNINAAVGSTVALIQQVGSSYQLVLNSTAEGDDPTFSVSDTGGFLDTKLTTSANDTSPNLTSIQSARDATFKYNGIQITRSSNEIDDIITGVTISLLSDTAASANISISQDVSAISEEMNSFVQNYNNLLSELNKMTTSDVEAGTVGIFSGDTTINAIAREINRSITSIDSNGLSLAQFGIDLNQSGIMSFNSSTFTAKFNEDPILAEKFMSGFTTANSSGVQTTDGVFTSMKSTLDRYIGYNGIISNLIDHSNNELKSFDENKKRSQALLDARYESMTARYIQYDAIISRLNNQFSSLQQQIEMAMNTRT